MKISHLRKKKILDSSKNSRLEASTTSRVFTDLLSNSPKRSPRLSPGREGRGKIFYLLNSLHLQDLKWAKINCISGFQYYVLQRSPRFSPGYEGVVNYMSTCFILAVTGGMERFDLPCYPCNFSNPQ